MILFNNFWWLEKYTHSLSLIPLSAFRRAWFSPSHYQPSAFRYSYKMYTSCISGHDVIQRFNHQEQIFDWKKKEAESDCVEINHFKLKIGGNLKSSDPKSPCVQNFPSTDRCDITTTWQEQDKDNNDNDGCGVWGICSHTLSNASNGRDSQRRL